MEAITYQMQYVQASEDSFLQQECHHLSLLYCLIFCESVILNLFEQIFQIFHNSKAPKNV